MFKKLISILILSCCWKLVAADFKAPVEMNNFCISCHDEEVQKGDVRLDNLDTLSIDARLEMLNRVQEQVYLGHMPPKEKKKQPSDSERMVLLNWISNSLKEHNASKLEQKLQLYKYANYLDHDKLFDGSVKDAAYTPSRRWKINEIIYVELLNEVFRLKEDKKGKGRINSFFGAVKPFNLPANSGVKYYANESVEGGEFLTLLANAEWVVDKQLRSALLKSGEFKYPEEFNKISQGEMFYKFPDELWNLKKTESEFEKIITTQGMPADSDLKIAINHQFNGALQREATELEMNKYLNFMKETIKLGGNTLGLRKMMVSVLMEPDFVYRSEIGGGTPDQFGRIKLTDREASYALAYALTDRIPDEKLVKAAKEGKLNSKEDYEREIRRMLADDKIAKPRLLRFFQDYFGYKNVLNVFKDEERFGAKYNPSRNTREYRLNVPGHLIDDADALVKWALKNDKNVFETLLTTEEFFVAHNGDNAAVKAQVAELVRLDELNRKIYLYMKDKPKEKDSAATLQHLKDKFGPDVKFAKRSLHNIIHVQFAERYGKNGDKPTLIPPPADSYYIKLYGLDMFEWSYVPEQPFKLNNRMGMLTHPAWLIAHSQNAHTDPVVRGKWIQEKLLAGTVPDVPITVDAKIPEDHDKTLRERFGVTEAESCWKCHVKMNPLGYVFESFDDFGRYRTEESLEHEDNITGTKMEFTISFGMFAKEKLPVYKTKPVNSQGFLKGTGNDKLDGEVKDYKDLINRLAKSDKVRQSFIRNVFRYFMGRNEMLSDSKTLIDADRVYVQSGGSFKELVVSLLTSDSFIYRKNIED